MECRPKAEKRTAIHAPSSKKRKIKPPVLKLATWKVRTTCPSLSDDLQQIKDARKTATIDRELKRLNIDISALQETRLPDSGSLKERDYTFFWQGQEPQEHRLYSVGLAVRNSLLSTVEAPFSSPSASPPLLDQPTS